MKFVYKQEDRVVAEAERLHEVQKRIAKLRAEVKVLEVEETQLVDSLRKLSKGKSFVFNSGRYQKAFTIIVQDRTILDQAKAKAMLKGKTPYRTVTSYQAKVDFVYE